MPHKQTEAEAKRAFTHGSGGANADMAVEGSPKPEDRHIEAPHARPAAPLPEGEKCDQLADKNAKAESHQEALLDEAIEETFPSSDPISPKHIT
ncbi:hypothetical protein LJR219_002173 [Phenylobacterium sp. LjRoot219]|uniref:hypothetical protein n=1 Tax=Phenylobacterium sp. LjRoot219 TaxID=3342283 RepID=UPI003ECE0377